MSPKPQDPELRTSLIDAAARLLTEHGPDALTTRRLAAEVGTSTMAVYTYFSGMTDLRRAVAKEGFDRLSAFLEDVRQTTDPVADVAALGGAYFLNGIVNSHLYHFMFVERPEDDPEVGHETFDRLVAGVARAIDKERFRKADPAMLASQLWAMAHGIVMLHLAGLFTLDEGVECMTEMGHNLFIAFGDDARSARRSIEKGRRRIQDGEIADTAALQT